VEDSICQEKSEPRIKKVHFSSSGKGVDINFGENGCES
jgi:hypothetical protein